jgi:membrane protease YdiL (CAAX protease family)
MQKDLLFKPVPDRDDSGNTTKNLFFLSIVALASLLVVSLVEPGIFQIGAFLGQKLDLTGLDNILFGVCMAIGEEEVFRGGFLNFFLQKKEGSRASPSPFVAMVASAGFFMVYHLAVYPYPSDLAALLFVFSAGLILAFVDMQIGLLAPSMFGHIGNNIITYSGLSIAGAAAALVSPWTLLIFGVGFLVFVLWVMKYGKKKGGRKR